MYTRSKEFAAAVEVFEAAYAAAKRLGVPLTANEYIDFGIALEDIQDDQSAARSVAVLQEGRDAFPEDEGLRYNLGCYLLETGSLAEALAEFEWSISKNAMHASSLYNRALTLVLMGDIERAAQSLEGAIKQALEEYGSAWYEHTPWVLRKIKPLIEKMHIHPTRTAHLLELVHRSALSEPPLADTAPGPKLALEFGVANGRSIARIAKTVLQHVPGTQLVHGFDSFIGLPEVWVDGKTQSDQIGEYTQGGRAPPNMPSNVRFHKGWINETLSPFLAEHRGPVAALHVDVDIYSATVEILTGLITRLMPGCVVRFDEFFIIRSLPNREMYDDYEARAWREAVALYGLVVEPLSFYGQALNFKIVRNPLFGKQPSDVPAWVGKPLAENPEQEGEEGGKEEL